MITGGRIYSYEHVFLIHWFLTFRTFGSLLINTLKCLTSISGSKLKNGITTEPPRNIFTDNTELFRYVILF